ncbi:hypothetical protein COLO4_21613 [Corchorus olitorius]|uniref:Uncharacterized protein n=1 Tax=Corchorus olitorius TaxID=93759 RepID=A0A1R3ISA0_9ROSI|nr:hypothetical protein COLO4_21613 [Corchorus olitorius]
MSERVRVRRISTGRRADKAGKLSSVYNEANVALLLAIGFEKNLDQAAVRALLDADENLPSRRRLILFFSSLILSFSAFSLF